MRSIWFPAATRSTRSPWLGIYSLDLSNPLTLVIYSDDCDGLLRQLRALLPDCLVP